MNPIDEIKALKEKQEKIRAVLSKAEAQREVALEERDKLLVKLKQEFDVDLENVEAMLADLKRKQEELVAEIKEKLDKINL